MPRPAPLAKPSGDVLFPLQSNAHALISGGGVNNVRSRLKVSSLLYDRIILESGRMSIQAGPKGSSAFRIGGDPQSETPWQTPLGRKKAEAATFSISIAPQTEFGVPATGPFHQLLESQTSICWLPTLEPFEKELPPDCDWVFLGSPVPAMPPEVKNLADRWRRSDDGNGALKSLVPEDFVRSQLLDHISTDLAVGAYSGWDVSVDRLHGRVISARFAESVGVEVHGLALPILVPRVADLSWDDVMQIRRMKEIVRLRKVLREVELEAFEAATSGADLEQAVRRAYDNRLRQAASGVESIRSGLGYSLMEFITGTGIGYATLGLAWAAPLVGAAAGVAITSGLQVRKMVRARRDRGWVGVISRISDMAP